MRFLFKIALTVNATFWMIVIYAIKEQWSVFNVSYQVVGLCLVVLSVIMSFVSLIISKACDQDEITEIQEFYLADNEFLPIYLGYFFVSLSIPSDVFTAMVIYFVVFLFTFVSQTQYFNPIFLLFRYHYYHVITTSGTRLFIIAKGKVIRNKDAMAFSNLRRVNDTTFITHKEK